MSHTVHPSDVIPSTSEGNEPTDETFKLSDLQSCRKYLIFFTIFYFLMVLTQVCSLLFMTFAGQFFLLILIEDGHFSEIKC